MMDKYNVKYVHNGVFFGNKKKLSTNTCYNLDKPWKYNAKCKTVVSKGHMSHDPIFVKSPE